MENWILDLLLTAPRVSDITVRLLDPYVDVIHENTYFNSAPLILIEIKVAAVLRCHQLVKVPGISHASEAFVLDGDHSPLSPLLRSVKEHSKTFEIGSVAEYIIELLWKPWLIRQEIRREAVGQVLVRLEHEFDVDFDGAV